MNPNADLSVVVFAPIAGDLATLSRIIESEQLNVLACADAREFYAALEGTPLFVVITEEGLALCSVDDIAHIFKQQPSWSSVPMLALADADERKIDRDRFVRLVEFGNVMVVTRPTTRLNLVIAFRSALRTRRLQFSVHDQLFEAGRYAERLESVVADRTRQLELEVAERRRVEQTLAETRRLESLGRLTGGVAHDFNNMLQVITGSETLLRLHLKGHTDPRAMKALDSIRRAAFHGASLTQQLLAYSRRQPLASVALDLRAHLKITVDMARQLLGSGVDVIVQVPASLWGVLADPSQLDAAVLNIVGNARDAIDRQGTVVIRGQNHVLPERGFPEGSYLTGEFVEISVTDSGHGMSQEVANQAFEPFFTTKPMGKGTGLGLSQVYGFAIQSQGIAFIRREEVGTTVGILLPRAEVEAERGTQGPSANLSGLHGLRVLVVEDDPEVAEVTTVMLESQGAHTSMVSSADAAIQQNLDTIDIVFSDVMMPGQLDGIGLARWLAEHRPELPVILTSGYVLDPERLTGLNAVFLRKPFVLESLKDAFENALNRSS